MDGVSLSEDAGVVDALEFYKMQEPTDTATIKMTTRLVASYYWWAGEKAKAYEILERYLAEYPDDDESRYTLLNLLVLDSDYRRMEYHLIQRMSADDSIRSFRKLHELAVVKFYNGDTEGALAYYDEAFNLVKDAEDSTLMWRLALPAYSDILSSAGNQRRAIEIRKRVLEHDRGNNPTEEALSYASLAWYHLQLNDIPTARRYVELAQSTKDETFDNDLSRAGYLQVVKLILDYAETSSIDVKEWGLFVNGLGDKAMVAQKITEAKREANWRLEEKNMQITIQRQKEQLLFLWMTFVMLFAIMGLLVWLRNRKSKLVEKEEEIDTLRKPLSESSDDKKDDRFFKKILLQQLGVIRLATSNPTSANLALLKRMREISNQEVDVDSILNWNDLYQTIDYIYDGFYTSLVNRFGAILNEKEIQLCCLLKANFSTKEISVVTQQSVRTVYQRKSTIRQTLQMPEAEDIANFLSII
jgi:tetratricopeptide (TPR) repeat protein